MNLKKILSSLLAITLCISSPLTSLAGGISGGSSAGQGDGAIGDATSSSGNGTWKIPSNTGFRFTIVDASGNPVSNIMGRSDSVSLDVINSGVNLSSGEVWTSCATDKNQSMNAYKYSKLSMSEFLSYIGESSHNFKWIDSAENLYGDEVREFILKGTKSTSDINNSGGLDSNTNTNPDSGGSSGSKLDPDREAKTLEGWRTIFASWVEKSKDKANQETLLNEIKTKRDISLTTDVMKLSGVGEWNLLGYYNNCVNQVLFNFGLNPDNIDNYKLFFYWDSKTKQQFPEAYNLYQEYKNFLKNRNKQTKQASNKSNLDLFSLFGGLTAYAAESDNSSGSSSTSGINTVNVDETSVLARIINLQVNGVYVFQLDGSAKTVAEQKQGAKSPLITFTENSYVLLVESTVQGCPQGWDKKNDKAGKSYKSLVYGTAHNWAMFGVSSSFKNSSAYSPSFGNHKRYIGQALPNALVTVSDWTGVLGKPVKDGQYVIADMQNLFRTGYGCHLYTTVDLVNPDLEVEKIDVYPGDWGGGNGIHTYDITTNPKTDYTTEPTLNKKDDSSIYKEKSNRFKIAKYYRYKDSISGKVTEISYYTVSDAPHTIQIMDEQVQTGFKLTEWFTSTDNWLPDGGKSPDTYNWESVIKGQHKSGQYSGTTEQLLTVKETDNDNVLHLLYEFTGKPFVNIVKVYKNGSDETIKTEGPEVSESNTSYTVEEKSDYEYIETLISKNDVDVENPEGTSTKDKTIQIESGTKTLYIIYKEPPHQLKLFSNELSYTYELKDLIKSRILFSIYDTVPKSPGTEYDCDVHTRYCSDDDCSGHDYTCSNGSHVLTDSMWSVKVKNNFDYNSTSFIKDYTDSGNLGGRWSTGISGKTVTANSSQVAKPNALFLLIRDKVDDLVTLYPNKNNSLSSELGSLGITTESYTPSQSRIEAEAIKDKDFTRTFVTDFVYTEHDTNLSWKWPRTKCGSSNKGTYSTQTVTDPEGANKYYSNSNNVKEYYLLGQNNVGSEEATDMRSDSFGTKYTYNKAYSSTSSDLKFYPYHLMLYRAKNSNANAQNVYVTSENLSTMKVYNAVQTGVYKKNPINALLSSTQWSTHARSLAFSGNSDKRSVIAGGGILDISLGNKGDTQLGIRLWQSCLRDEMVETVQADSFNTSLSKAKEVANSYKEEVKTVLSGYGLVQWGTEGINTDLNSVLSGVELHNNTSLDWDNRSYKTSGDSKYYLKHDSQGSDRANFDVLDSKVNKQTFYEISSDVDGNVILKKDNTEIARASLSQDKSAILSNTEAKLLDDNTKLITNFFSSIDRGLGDSNKYDRTNSRKYNEAYDGVGVLLTELSFSVGFSDNSGHRTTVLDTLLTSTAESKSELYDFTDENKIRSFVFATRKTSSTSSSDKVGYIGTLQGDSNMQSITSVLSDIQSFVYTKNFYTSNFNVTDLN